MTALNYIVVDGICPACGKAGKIRFPTCIASGSRGDESGSFCAGMYQLGERMAWWSEDHPGFPEWRDASDPVQRTDVAIETCRATCRCGAGLYAIVRFRNVTPVEVVEVGLEEYEPDRYHPSYQPRDGGPRRSAALSRLRASLSKFDQTLLTLRLNRGMAWEKIADVLSDDGKKMSAASVRKRFEKVKVRLTKLARKQGLLK